MAAETREVRGFSMGSNSKSYTCRGVARDTAADNNGSDLGGGSGLAQGYLAKMVDRARRKAGSTEQPHVRQFHKSRH